MIAEVIGHIHKVLLGAAAHFVARVCVLILVLCSGWANAETIRVEAENYSGAYDTTAGNSFSSPPCTYNGLNVDVSGTADGGCKVGNTPDTEWLEYTVNAQYAATYRLTFRYATGADGNTRQVDIKRGATTLQTLLLPPTTGYEQFVNFTSTVALNAGVQTLRFNIVKGWLDINWFELDLTVVGIGTGVTRVEAENYNAANDLTPGNGGGNACTQRGLSVDVVATGDAGGGCKVGDFHTGEWLEYAINVPVAGHYRLKYRYSSGFSSDPGMFLKINGVTEWTQTLPVTGNYETFADRYFMRWFAAGTYILRVQSTAALHDFNYLSFERETVDIVGNNIYKIEAEDYINASDSTVGNTFDTDGASPTNCPYYGYDADVTNAPDGTCFVGYTLGGEYLEYSINVDVAANFLVSYNYGASTATPGSNLYFKSNGTQKADTPLTSTGGWTTFATIMTTLALPAGQQTVRIEWNNYWQNFNWLKIERKVPSYMAVTVGTTASTCTPAVVTFTMFYANGEVVTNYTGTITITTSKGHGNWTKTGVAADAYGTLTAGANDSGSAQYTFTGADNGSVKLALSNGRTEALTVSAVNALYGAVGTSGSVAFSTNSFTTTDITGGARVVGYPQVWRISMMKKDPITGTCGVNTNYSKTGVKAWAVRGAADAGGTAATLVDTGSASSVALPTTEPGANNFNLTFVNGIAEFRVNTTDVLKHTVYIADKSRSFADVDLVTDLGEQTFVPFGFAVTAVSNPGATSGAGAVYRSAGTAFTVNVTAVRWDAADDVDNNKIPDGHDSAGNGSRANLTNNAVAARFGYESPAEKITLTAALLLPAGGSDPGLGDADASANDGRIITSFTSGAGSTSQVYFNEVGIVEIRAAISDGNYMGGGANTTRSNSYSGKIGRFTPAKFNFGSGFLTEACQTGIDYSYMGQNFSGQFTLSPVSSLGTSMQNYVGAFAKLVVGDIDFFARDVAAATVLTARLSASATAINWSAGTGTVLANIALGRAAVPDGPFPSATLATNFDDSDGISLAAASKNFDADANTSLDSASFGVTTVRYGRLRLGSAHGPETAALKIPLVTEYWSSGSWLINQDDSCTAIARTAITYPSGAINNASYRTVAVASGSTVGSYGSIVGDSVVFIAGDANHQFSAPGTGKTGSFKTQINLASYPWLRFDWNADGNYTDTLTPENNINFGSYRGHDRILFWQEY